MEALFITSGVFGAAILVAILLSSEREIVAPVRPLTTAAMVDGVVFRAWNPEVPPSTSREPLDLAALRAELLGSLDGPVYVTLTDAEGAVR